MQWGVTIMSKFTIEFSEEADKEIDEIAKRLCVNSRVEVIRKALGLLNFATMEQGDGGEIVIENERLNTRKTITEI